MSGLKMQPYLSDIRDRQKIFQDESPLQNASYKKGSGLGPDKENCIIDFSV
jgi:hypothetical protein